MFDIDFVVLWVDGADKAWIDEYNKYVSADKKIDVSKIRYRDNGLLKFWFRCIEKNAPWVRKVHFVTCGQKPGWLNENCKKLNLVSHSDFLPADCIPTFSSRAIETSVHLIPNLADHFVFFNDDFYLVNKIKPDYFFTKDGVVKDCAVLYPITPGVYGHTLMCNTTVARSVVDITSAIQNNKSKWLNLKYGKLFFRNLLFCKWKKSMGLRMSHYGHPYTKKMFYDAWEQLPKELAETRHNRFRSQDTVNLSLIREINILRGNFAPSNIYKYNKFHDLSDNLESICKDIFSNKYRQVVINDQDVSDFESRTEKIRKAFEKKFSEKSEFEKI